MIRRYILLFAAPLLLSACSSASNTTADTTSSQASGNSPVQSSSMDAADMTAADCLQFVSSVKTNAMNCINPKLTAADMPPLQDLDTSQTDVMQRCNNDQQCVVTFVEILQGCMQQYFTPEVEAKMSACELKTASSAN